MEKETYQVLKIKLKTLQHLKIQREPRFTSAMAFSSL